MESPNPTMAATDADVLIIGGGPAGLSAALTLLRQNHTVLVLDMGASRALPSLRLHAILASDDTPPRDILAKAHVELASYSGFFPVHTEIVQVTKNDRGFEARDANGKTYQGRKVILANGVQDVFPDIAGYAEAWGKGIFHNPFAQGYQKDPSHVHSGVLAVDYIAMPKYTLHLTHLLSQLTSTVTIYTHGNTDLASTLEPIIAKAINKPSTVKIDQRTISRIALVTPGETMVDIHFTDGSSTGEAFLGHAAMTRLNGPFADQLGVDVSQAGAEYLVAGPTNATNVKGVYAAGDAAAMLKVWPNAVASGAVAAAGVAVSLQEDTWGLDPIFG